jgi:hypothetical protein
MRNLRPTSLVLLSALSIVAVACSKDATAPTAPPDQIELTTGQIHSLDSTGHVIEQANVSDATLRALIDSTLLVLTSGVVAKRVDVATNLTSAPLYFVGVHRVVNYAGGGSFSTWNLTGLDDPSRLTSLIEVSGFAQSTTAAAPTSVSGTVGDGKGLVNGLFLSVGSGGAVTEWFASTGTVSFSSQNKTVACPNFTPAPNLTCALETMTVRFTISSPPALPPGTSRQASVSTDVDVPTMRLTYTAP